MMILWIDNDSSVKGAQKLHIFWTCSLMLLQKLLVLHLVQLNKRMSVPVSLWLLIFVRVFALLTIMYTDVLLVPRRLANLRPTKMRLLLRFVQMDCLMAKCERSQRLLLIVISIILTHKTMKYCTSVIVAVIITVWLYHMMQKSHLSTSLWHWYWNQLVYHVVLKWTDSVTKVVQL